MGENENLNASTQSNEDVLTDISAGYEKKKKKKNIIIFSVISAVLLVLSALIISFSAIKVDLKPKSLGDATWVELKVDGVTRRYDQLDSEYEEFYNNYNKAFSTSYLTALFTGSTSGYEIEEITSNFYSTFSNGIGSGMSSDLTSRVGSNYIHLYFNDSQTLKTSSGKDYYSTRNTSEYLLTYYDVYIPVSSSNKLSDVTFYFGTYGYSQNPRITKLTVKGNTSHIYEFAQD